jgi:hypothetical protein
MSSSNGVVYAWCGVVSGNHPVATRMTHPEVFGVGKRGWVEWAENYLTAIRAMRAQAPRLRFKPLIHLRAGAVSPGDFRLDGGIDARTCPVLGDVGSFLYAVASIVGECGMRAALYVGRPDAGRSVATDPVQIFEQAEGDVMRSGLFDEVTVDGTALTKMARDASMPGGDRPDPRILRLFDHIAGRYGCAVRCEAWPAAWNAKIARGGVVLRENVWWQQVFERSQTGTYNPLAVKPWALPHSEIAGPILLACIDRNADTVAHARQWSELSPRHQVAIEPMTFVSRKFDAAKLLEAVAPALAAAPDEVAG